MKQLILVRHAKAEKEGHGIKDFERVLTNGGIHAALKMGVILSEKGIKIQQMVSSSSARTKMTSEYLAERLPLSEEKIIYKEELYLASLRIWLQEINNLDDAKDCIAMVGHNPEISYLAEYLTKEDIGTMPTCGVLIIHFELDTWKAISQGLGKLQNTIYLQEEN